MHHSLAGTLAKRLIKNRAVVLRQVVADERLTTVFIDSLEDLQSSITVFSFTSGAPGHTLYPAAYPRPGNSEVNFVPTDAEANSLKMTWLKAAVVLT
jgi:hypothetical protein